MMSILSHAFLECSAIARKHKDTTPHLNVLVVGMPNVGKSTIINHLRSYGIRGGEHPPFHTIFSVCPVSNTPLSASSSVLRTSRLPGMTRATSNKLRLCDDPLIYSVDSPGVMIPFLGYGDESRERAVKISLICQSFQFNTPSPLSHDEWN
jgi:mitochondrial GTPase 1